MKFDIVDFFWGPRLIIGNIFDGIKNIGKKKSTERVFLPMNEFDEGHFYPRPHLVRDSYLSLDGEWEFANIGSGACPADFTDKINVPFAPQAKRSGIDFDVLEKFWYKKTFTLPKDFMKSRLILHFGAVDQMCECFINGHSVGINIGGYLPFSFDITEYVTASALNTITLHVKDTCDTTYPLGKQVKEPGGMWYTNISGIWQSVWLESVSEEHVKSISHKWDGQCVSFDIKGINEGTLSICEAKIYSKEECDSKAMFGNAIKDIEIKEGHAAYAPESPMLWSPDKPYLYAIRITTNEDVVYSYFSLRTISIEKFNSKNRICLNHKPVFLHSVLDQGYFSDGIYTPPSDRYYDKDIFSMKELGFNMLRKHIKLESAYFYFACDKYGMMVSQDMINNGDYNYFRETLLPTFFGQTQSDAHFNEPDEAKDFFISHSLNMIEYLKPFACVVYYTVFNEGWGQFDSNRVTRLLKETDPDKIYDSTSGWFKQPNSLLNVTDVESDHFYFHKIKPKSRKRYKPVIISECGGFSMCIKKHCFAPDNVYGYGSYDDKKSLTERIIKMYDEEVIPNIKHGICGVVYTQLSDVEEEVNGLYTYDRALCKIDKEKFKQLSERLHEAFSKNCQ